MKNQKAAQIVDVGNWQRDPDYDGVFPKGARAKEALFCPTESPFPFLIGSHRYLFKKSVHRHPHQFWMEIIAYRIGLIMGVKVPPAFAAFNGPTGEAGALIEWFYGYPNQPVERYIDGGSYMKRLDKYYDLDKGRRHNLQYIIRVVRALSRGKVLAENWLETWVKIFTFDAVIGNTDRHHDNWGVIWCTTKRMKTAELLLKLLWKILTIKKKGLDDLIQAKISPAFDNGTSLGHEIIDEKLHEFVGEKLDRYIMRGTHHMRLTYDGERINHIEFLVYIVEKYPGTLNIIKDCINFDRKKVEGMIMNLIEFETPVILSTERASFMVELIMKRREMIAKRLGI